MLYLVLISLGIYIIYNIASICKYQDLPECLSATHYIWHPNWIFPIVMIAISGLLLPVWLELLEGSNFQFLAFITCASIIFIGFTPDYKNDKLECKIHSICTYIACLTSIAAISIVMGYLDILLTYIIVTFITSLVIDGFKTLKEIWLYLIELVLFLTVYSSILIELINGKY